MQTEKNTGTARKQANSFIAKKPIKWE
jgi:hypothetical protein